MSKITDADRALAGMLKFAVPAENLTPRDPKPAPVAAKSAKSQAVESSEATPKKTRAKKGEGKSAKPKSKKSRLDSCELTTYSGTELSLKKSNLPRSILSVCEELKDAGFDCYIVGGGVRDQLVGLAPKDFDAVTNATPQQIQEVFGRQCRIIGRRFELAHVRFGREIIEVATFRAPPKHASGVNAAGMVVRDNVWGTIEQDFIRRDFGINALYYDPIDDVVLDFCGSIEDINQKRISFLGITQVRIDEDPVRLLRALRFAAKLNFELCDDVKAAFTEDNWEHLKSVSAHRLYDETLKIFGSGAAAAAMPLLKTYNAEHHLFVHPQNIVTPLVERIAANTDERLKIGKSINPAFFYCALLWPAYEQQLETLRAKMPLAEAIDKASIQVINTQRQITAMPRFAEQFIREVWSLQPRLAYPKPKQIPALAELPRFRAGFDFLLMRELTGEDTGGMGEWWERYQSAETNSEREQLIKAYGKTYKTRKNAPAAKPAQESSAPEKVAPVQEPEHSDDLSDLGSFEKSAPRRQHDGPPRRKRPASIDTLSVDEILSAPIASKTPEVAAEQ